MSRKPIWQSMQSEGKEMGRSDTRGGQDEGTWGYTQDCGARGSDTQYRRGGRKGQWQTGRNSQQHLSHTHIKSLLNMFVFTSLAMLLLCSKMLVISDKQVLGRALKSCNYQNCPIMVTKLEKEEWNPELLQNSMEKLKILEYKCAAAFQALPECQLLFLF